MATPAANGTSQDRGRIRAEAMATQDHSHICNLCRRSQQHYILDPLREDRIEPASSQRQCQALNLVSGNGNSSWFSRQPLSYLFFYLNVPPLQFLLVIYPLIHNILIMECFIVQFPFKSSQFLLIPSIPKNVSRDPKSSISFYDNIRIFLFFRLWWHLHWLSKGV